MSKDQNKSPKATSASIGKTISVDTGTVVNSKSSKSSKIDSKENINNNNSSSSSLNIPISDTGRGRSNSMNSTYVINSNGDGGRSRSSSVSGCSEVHTHYPCNINGNNSNSGGSGGSSGSSGSSCSNSSTSSNNSNNSNKINNNNNNNSFKFKKEKIIKFNSTTTLSPELIGGMGIAGGTGNDKYTFVLTSSPSPNTYFNSVNTGSVINNFSQFSLQDEGYLDTLLYESLKEPNTLIKQRELSIAWTNVNIPTNSAQARKDLKFLIRKGIPDKKRGLVWQAIIGTKDADQDHCYLSAYSSSFGEDSDPNIRNIPAFGGLVSPSDHLITEQGVKQVKSVLNLIHTNSHVEYCPQLSDLVHILLSFMSEANTYTSISLMMKESESNVHHRFLNLDKKECTKFVHSFDHLVELHLPKLQRHMITIGLTNSFVFSDEWFSRLFVSFLPYNTVLRIFDVLLSEGYKVLYRIGLALLKTHKKTLKKQNNIDKFLSTLKQLNSQMVDADALIKVAFELSLKRSHLEDISDKQHHKVKDVPEPAPIYYRPKISIPSDILNSDDFELIWAWLPARLSVASPRRLFNSVTGGSNIRLLYEAIEEKLSILVLLKSDNGSVFGFFSDSEVKPRPGFGDRNCFLFKLKPHVHVYKPTEKNNLYMNLKENTISVGQSNHGEIGLHINADLNGTSGPTETFGNPCLNDKDQYAFQTVVLEAFTIE